MANDLGWHRSGYTVTRRATAVAAVTGLTAAVAPPRSAVPSIVLPPGRRWSHQVRDATQVENQHVGNGDASRHPRSRPRGRRCPREVARCAAGSLPAPNTTTGLRFRRVVPMAGTRSIRHYDATAGPLLLCARMFRTHVIDNSHYP